MQTPAAFEYERATSVEGAIASLERLGREAPIAMANPAGAALRDTQYSSASAGKLYRDVRNTRPEKLPRSPVIGADAPVQYEQRDDIGKPRKRMPAQG